MNCIKTEYYKVIPNGFWRERERQRELTQRVTFIFFEVGVPAGCLLIRFVFFSGLLQNMSKWRIVCIREGDVGLLSLWTWVLEG